MIQIAAYSTHLSVNFLDFSLAIKNYLEQQLYPGWLISQKTDYSKRIIVLYLLLINFINLAKNSILFTLRKKETRTEME